MHMLQKFIENKMFGSVVQRNIQNVLQDIVISGISKLLWPSV